MHSYLQIIFMHSYFLIIFMHSYILINDHFFILFLTAILQRLLKKLSVFFCPSYTTTLLFVFVVDLILLLTSLSVKELSFKKEKLLFFLFFYSIYWID